MSSVYGKNIKISIFGQSHSKAIGVIIDGLPAGIRVDSDELRSFLRRRAPGQSELATPRVESDEPEILSGLVDNVTCGAPLAVIIRNTDTRSEDYRQIRDIPRPSHADYTAHIKYGGYQDSAGGGHFSGRLTAPLCAAGGIFLQILRGLGIDIKARIVAVGGVKEPSPVTNSEANSDAISEFASEIASAKADGDSVGGIIECVAAGVPAGLGDPIFDGMENRIVSAVFGIPGIKGIEFGSGFAAAGMRGSEHNDCFYMSGGDGDTVMTRTNNSGGIQGGITNGMPVVFRVAVKPTPSICIEQDSISLERRENVKLKTGGRHDPCIVPRAVPCVEAAAAIAIYDAWAGFITPRKDKYHHL